MNNHDVEAQDATFTLTNVAPQFSRFNELAWREYECLGADSINIDSLVCIVITSKVCKDFTRESANTFAPKVVESLCRLWRL